ncbi:MAG: hypothetical protein ACU837_16270 [Gammaproteobacteria bacterium]
MSDKADNRCTEAWGSRLGVILAVAGSAVGLGNFLRFPGQAAANGGGAFMIPYFVSFLLVGIPICWAEWSMGRYGGRFGFNSAPGIFSTLARSSYAKYFGALGLLIPVIIYMYYVYIESWCLAYAWFFAAGDLDLGRNPSVYATFFGRFTGMQAHGAAFKDGIQPVFWFFLATFTVNFYFIYRGLSRGIETFCKYAIPLLIVAAIVVAVRVLTLPEQPIPKPWQETLPKVLPAAEWQALHDMAENPEVTPKSLKAKVESVIAAYLQQQSTRSAATPQAEQVMAPAGFAKEPAAYALAMAEMRAEDAGQRYRRWIENTRETLPQDIKLQLRELESQELKLDTSHVAATAIERARLDAERRQLFAGIPALEIQVLAPYLAGVKGAEKFGDAERLVWRAAALETAELPRTVINGLGYMWNPDFGKLRDPAVWLAAAGQIFFSLSVGFGVILTYASYLRRNDDVVLSGLTASATNEFCEVCLGGLVAIPATFIFLGTAMTLEAVSSSTFGLGFNTLPSVFANMPAGRWFGAVWFALLFLAAITSSLSMLQPAIAFLEEGFGLRRRASVTALGLLTLSGALLVVYFSGNAVVLSTMDDWVGTVAIYLLATIEIIVFAWVIGVDRGMEEANRGGDIRIPKLFRWVFKYVTPAFLLIIFGAWLLQSLPEKLAAIKAQPEVLLTVMYLAISLVFLLLLVALAGENWRRNNKGAEEIEQ